MSAPPKAPPVLTPKATAQPALVVKPLAGDPAHVTIHRLSNGMTVYLSPDPAQPSIVAHVAVRAGSASDPESSTGLAHYLEHMLFKGTSKLGTLDYAREKVSLDRIAALYDDLRKPNADRPTILKAIDDATQASAQLAVPNELDQLYRRIGISGLNAFTNTDATVYISEIPKNRISQWARVEAARYSDAVFRLFWPELEAVYEEKNRGLDSPPRRAYEAFVAALYPRHGYGRPTLGEIEHLKSPAYGDMVRFFDRYYTPTNMAILLAGDVDESVLPILEQEFGHWARPAGDANVPGPLVPLAGRSEVEVKVPSDEGVLLGWQLVAATAKDRSALELMDLLLLDDKSGMLSRDLLFPQKVAGAGCSPTFLREAGYYQMWADALDGQTHADLEKLLLGLVAKLQRGEFTDADLATAILRADIQEQRQLETNDGRMSMMQQAFIIGEDWPDAVAHLAQLRAVTKADIVRVATQYLSTNLIVVKKVKGQATSPKIVKPGITPVKLDPTRASEFGKAILAMPVTPIEPVALVAGPDYTRGLLPTGELVAVKNTRNSLFSITYQYDFGRADDHMACFAVDLLKFAGAGDRPAEQVANELHALGLSIDTMCTRQFTRLIVSGVDRNMEAGIALLRAWLGTPRIDDQALASRIAATLTERTNQIIAPAAIARAQQNFARWGADSDTLVVPTNQQIQAAKAPALEALLHGFLTRKHRTMYFGPRAPIGPGLAAITLGEGKVAPTPRAPSKFRAPNQVFFTDQETAQTQVWMIWPRKPADDADRALGQVFATYFAPLVYQEIREARGLAYTAYGSYGPGAHKPDDAQVYIYVGTQGDKTHDAIAAIHDVLGEPIDDTNFMVAREAIAQGHRVDRIEPRSIAATVFGWQDEGAIGDPREARTQQALAVDKAQLAAWMKAAFARPLIVSVVGDAKKLDLDKLKALAPVTTVPVGKLFGY